jgi:hypothetical protein
MSIQTFAQTLADTRLSIVLTDSSWLFGTLEAVHVLAITLVVGSIAVVDLRLIGGGPAHGSARQVLQRLLPFTLGAFALAVTTGGLLIFANPVGYSGNTWFGVKVTLLVLAGINALVFHLFFQNRLGDQASWAPRLSGAVSLTLWVGVVAAARWIGYTL